MMAAIRLESLWFRSYSKALLTDDPLARHVFVKAALDAIHETLRQPGIQAEERQAISAAIRDLNLLECRYAFCKGFVNLTHTRDTGKIHLVRSRTHRSL